MNGSGLDLGITLSTPLSTTLLNTVKQIAGLDDISIDLGLTESIGYASRTNDASPWKGGARIRHTYSGGYSICSSGFAVLSGSSGRLLTARHCDTSADRPVKDGAGTQIAPGGSSVSGKAAIDSLLIDPSASPATTPKVYYGGYASTYTVKNWYSNWVGDPVCSSGASTGAHCGTVYDDGQVITFNGTSVNVIQVKAASGSIIGGQGDSGGPMYQQVTGGVQARGILLGPDTAYAQTTSCGSVNPDVSPVNCSRYINYVPISTILNSWGVSLEVG